MKLSIIIPAYNAENVLEHCLNSLIYSLRNASDDEAEIICVNDGSTDNTREILQRYMAEDARIRIFHKKNGGVSSARNLGLSKVTGDYVAWVDADDYVTSDWYEEIRTRLADEPDCIVFDYFWTTEGENRDCHIRLPEVVTLNAFTYEQSLERELKNFLWNQVIRTDILRLAHFYEEYHTQEDYAFLTQVTPHFEYIIHIQKCLYHYVQNELSLMHNVSADDLWQTIHIVKKRYEQYRSLGIAVNINDYIMQLIRYLYGSDSRTNDKLWRERREVCKTLLKAHAYKVLRDEDITRSMKVKTFFAVCGLDTVLYKLLCIKRAI